MSFNLLEEAKVLLEEVQTGLASRKEEWRKIASDTGYSYEFISRLGLRTYKSSPTIERLQKIADRLKNGSARRKLGAQRPSIR